MLFRLAMVAVTFVLVSAFASPAQADIYQRINECENIGGGDCVFDLLRELANARPGNGGGAACTIPSTSGSCQLTTMGNGAWTYVIYRHGALIDDPRWSSYGGLTNGTHSQDGACRFFRVLVNEGSCR